MLIKEYKEYDKNKWANIGAKIGKSAKGCKKRAAELQLISNT
jgi:hypothetical protein